jgi:hypothetical protein
MFLQGNIDGEKYKDFIKFAINNSERFILVERNDMDKGSNIALLLKALDPYLISIEYGNEWPGTNLMGNNAKIYYFNSHSQCSEILLKFSNSIFSWVQPNLLEDLCFLKENNNPWIVNVAHEYELLFINLTANEYDTLKKIGIEFEV